MTIGKTRQIVPLYIGIDMGYGEIKGSLNEGYLGSAINFPTVYAISDTSVKNSLDQSITSYSATTISSQVENMAITTNGKSFLVGANCNKESADKRNYLFNEDGGRYANAMSFTMINIAIELLIADVAKKNGISLDEVEFEVYLGLGLPITEYKSNHETKDVESSFSSDAKNRTASFDWLMGGLTDAVRPKYQTELIKVYPQGYGALISVVYNSDFELTDSYKQIPNEAYLVLVDIGHRTTDIVLVSIDSEKGEAITHNQQAHSIEMGVRTFFNSIEKFVSEVTFHKTKINEEQIRELLKKNVDSGVYKLYVGKNAKIMDNVAHHYENKYLDITEQILIAKEEFVSSFYSKLSSLLPSEIYTSIDTFTFTGGGAVVFSKQLTDKYGDDFDVIISPKAQYDNATGFSRFMLMEFGADEDDEFDEE